MAFKALKKICILRVWAGNTGSRACRPLSESEHPFEHLPWLVNTSVYFRFQVDAILLNALVVRSFLKVKTSFSLTRRGFSR